MVRCKVTTRCDAIRDVVRVVVGFFTFVVGKVYEGWMLTDLAVVALTSPVHLKQIALVSS